MHRRNIEIGQKYYHKRHRDTVYLGVRLNSGEKTLIVIESPTSSSSGVEVISPESGECGREFWQHFRNFPWPTSEKIDSFTVSEDGAYLEEGTVVRYIPAHMITSLYEALQRQKQ